MGGLGIYNQNLFFPPLCLSLLLFYIRRRYFHGSSSSTSSASASKRSLLNPAISIPINDQYIDASSRSASSSSFSSLPWTHFLSHPQLFLSRFSSFLAHIWRTSDRLNRFLLFLAIICLFSALLFEFYFLAFRCQVSSRYYSENVEIARRVMNVFEKEQFIYWLDYATLLSYLRGNQGNLWEHDHDFSVLHPAYWQSIKDRQRSPDHEWDAAIPRAPQVHTSYLEPIELSASPVIREMIEKLSNGLAASLAENPDSPQTGIRLSEENLRVSYDPKRRLVQVGSKYGPHMDIWIWTPEVQADDSLRIWTADSAVWYHPRDWSMIYPTKRVQWLGVPSSVPAEAAKVSDLEFSHYGGDFMIPIVVRGDCTHNIFQGRLFY